jgi:hypothetical protein
MTKLFESYFLQLSDIVKSFKAQVQTFYKNPKRTYKRVNLEARKVQNEELKNKFNLILKSIEKECKLKASSVETLVNLKSTFIETFLALEKLISEKIEIQSQEEPEVIDIDLSDIFDREVENQSAIIKMDFNFDTAMKLPTLEDADENKVRDFLDSVQAYHDILKDNANKLLLIRYVVKAKVKGVAKTKLGETFDPENFIRFGEEIRAKCGSTETYETIRMRLNNAEQGTKSLEAFAAEVNQIAGRLAAIEIRRQGNASRTVVLSMANQDALVAFKKGVNPILRTVVEAARPNTVEIALQVASAASVAATPVKNESESHLYHATQDRPIVCYTCGKTGHIARNCFANRYQNQEQNYASGNGRGFGQRGRGHNSLRGQSIQFNNRGSRGNRGQRRFFFADGETGESTAANGANDPHNGLGFQE